MLELALERVREQGVDPCELVLERTKLYLGVSAILGVLVARRLVFDRPTWCGAASMSIVWGTWRPQPLLVKLLSGNRDQGVRGDSVSLEET